MLTLIILTFLVFIVMWLGDLYLTVKTVKKIGHEAEINPLMRKFLSFRGRFIYVFKFIELAAFLYLLYFLTTFTGIIPFYVLLGYIFVYGILVANNSHVYFEVSGEEPSALRYLFIAVVVLIMLFIYLNYSFTNDLTTSYKALSQCHDSYLNLSNLCQQQNITTTQTLPADLLNTIKELNLTIPKGALR